MRSTKKLRQSVRESLTGNNRSGRTDRTASVEVEDFDDIKAHYAALKNAEDKGARNCDYPEAHEAHMAENGECPWCGSFTASKTANTYRIVQLPESGWVVDMVSDRGMAGHEHFTEQVWDTEEAAEEWARNNYGGTNRIATKTATMFLDFSNLVEEALTWVEMGAAPEAIFTQHEWFAGHPAVDQFIKVLKQYARGILVRSEAEQQLALILVTSRSASKTAGYSIKQVLIDRDGYSAAEADSVIEQARMAIEEGADPEQVLMDEFGLEPDYIDDLVTASRKTAGIQLTDDQLRIIEDAAGEHDHIALIDENGKLAAECFPNDFPKFIRLVSQDDVDLAAMLESPQTRPFGYGDTMIFSWPHLDIPRNFAHDWEDLRDQIFGGY